MTIKCQDCDEGREIFRISIEMLKRETRLREGRREKVIAEFQAMIDRPSNCGNPKCSNLCVADMLSVLD